MKKLVAISILLFAFHSLSQAQKVGYVDTKGIMEKIPEYAAVQSEVDRLSQQWQEGLEKMYADIERMYKEYTAQEVLLPEDVKIAKQEEIFAAERKAKEYRESKFGYEGALFKIQQSKIRPIQDKVFKAVETVAKRRKVAMVFDKAGEITWLYTDATYDLSDEVLKEMGYGKDK